MAALAVRGLAKRYGSVEALAGVDLEVARGRARRPARPERRRQVDARQDRLRARPADARARAEICGAPAGSPAGAAALGYLAELFRFPGWYRRTSCSTCTSGSPARAEARPSGRELLELVGLADARDRRVEAMSKGMQQRLGIAQALVGSPRAAPARRADERARPGRPPHRPRLLEELRARGIVGAAQLAPARARSSSSATASRSCSQESSSPRARRRSSRGRAASRSRPTRARASSTTPPARTRRASSPSWSRRAGRSTASACCTSTLEETYLEAVGGESVVSVGPRPSSGYGFRESAAAQGLRGRRCC